MKQRYRLLSVITLFWTLTLVVNAQDIHGYVFDAQTGDSIPYANATYKGKKVLAAGNEHGQFHIARNNGWTLTVTAVGYKPRTIKITEKTSSELRVTLIADSKMMETVVVKAKRRHKYSRKENPAVELMKRVIAAKKQTNLENHDYYQYNKYQKITMALNDLTPESLESGLFKKFPWLLQQVELCPFNNKLILPLSVDETLTQHLYRKTPHAEKDLIMGQNTRGISKLVQTGEVMNTVVKDIFKDIDLYDDHINILQSRFPSPIGSTAISFYHFYIDDTVYVDHEPCTRLQFMPANPQDFGFRGELYVLNDSSLHVKKCDMQLPAGTGVNWVEAMKIQQTYSRLPNGEWALYSDNMVAELKIIDLLQQALVIRTTNMSHYAFEEIPDKQFKGKARTEIAANAKIHNEDFWAEHRTVELTKSEADMGNFMKRMSEAKNFKWLMAGLRLMIENFIETGSEVHPSKFDIGPVNTFVSKNFVDGFRLRLSGRTTAKLSSHWFGEGYYAYGIDSRKHYYGAKATYTFNKPEFQPHEFPIRSVSFESTYDMMSPSDKYLIHNKDNMFMAFRPMKVEQMYFYNRQTLGFKWETDNGLAFNAQLKAESNQPTGTLEFRRVSDGVLVHNIRMTDMTIGLEFHPGATYINTKMQRLEANLDAPRFTISHTIGVNHLLGSQFSYQLTEASAYKRFWMGSWGNIDTILKVGAQWSKVPMPLLIMPAVNTSFFENYNTFNMLENMEFLNDRYVQFGAAWVMNGKIFNRIPLLKKLKWREYFAVKGLWGKLTDKNNPYITANATDTHLYQFPAETRLMTNDPYMELVVGVHNILKCLEVDYVRRLTYNHFPGIEKNGIRFGFNVNF